jgi:glycosyltransferase involved in cell wall biosynthesis
MIHIFINALAASAGGGLTYVRNVIPHMGSRGDMRATVLLNARLRGELPPSANLAFIEHEVPASAIHRIWFEQRTVRELIRRFGANVLLSTGNFALWNSPVAQILLSRNSLYTSRDFLRDLHARGDSRLWLETLLKGSFAKWSIQAADCVVAPSQAFADELQAWTARPIAALHHGFDGEAFVRDRSELPGALRQRLESAGNALRLLFVSHYNYYRNFETLIRSLPLIKGRIKPRALRLFLTCKLAPGANPGAYDTNFAATLVRDLRLRDEIVELGALPYKQLHHVYRAADIYVSAAYAESFAHPLVEAMSSGIPVVASDLVVHREISGPAALYFERFSPQELADRVLDIAESPRLGRQLSQAGVERSAAFSWKLHVDRILQLAGNLILERSDTGRRFHSSPITESNLASTSTNK